METWQVVIGVIALLLAIAGLVFVMKKKEPPGGPQAEWPEPPPVEVPPVYPDAPATDVEAQDSGGGSKPGLPP